MAAPSLDGTLLMERLSSLPGGRELVEVTQGRSDVELVGGAVRDLLLERQPRELDVVVAAEGESGRTAAAAGEAAGFGTAAGSLARDLANALERAAAAGEAGVCAPVQMTVHERFGTAAVAAGDARIDVATRRAERYAHPGALPDVRPGDGDEDLARRDFTVNAIAVALGGSARGKARFAEHALDDLEHRRLRVLHARSFVDDPTRLLRLCRYAARLSFEIEEETESLAREAARASALLTVSGARVGAEMRLLLAEPDPVAALVQLQELGVLGALVDGDAAASLRLDARLLAAALALLGGEGRRELVTLAALLLGVAPESARALLDDWEHPAGDRDVVLAAAGDATGLASRIAAAERPSQLARAIENATPEAVALAGACGGEPVRARAGDWLARLRHVRLAIDGTDLLEEGVPEGPEIGRRLAHVLALRLDGELGDEREVQLDAALSAADGGAG